MIAVLMPRHYAEMALGKDERDLLDELGEVYYNPNLSEELQGEERRHVIGQSTALITGWQTPWITREEIDNAPDLCAIAHAMGSTNGWDIAEDYGGIKVFNAAEGYVPAVAEYIVGAALTSLRRISKVDRAIHQKSDEEVWWGTDNILDPSACHPAELHGKNAGLIGLGRIGRYLAGLLQPFNVDVRAYDPYVEDSVFEESHCQRMELSDLLASSDIIVPLLPEVDETRNLLDGSALARIQEGALILNASRGFVIDQEALIRNLQERRLWAALDVYEDEPLPDDSPLRKLDNVILTSHMAGPTPESARRHAAIAVEQLYEYMKS